MQSSLGLAVLLALAMALPDPAGGQPLNVLVLHADDWRHDTLGCAGNAVVLTPHLDQLARDGIRFTNHHVTTSICGVSRATLFTGQWMSRHGNEAFGSFRTPWGETYPGILRSRGYWVGHVGKWHNGQFPAASFDFGRSYAGTHWMKKADGTAVHVTQRNEEDALEFLRSRPADSPFCLTLSFFAAHAEDGNPKQYLPQPGSRELYSETAVPVPPTATDGHFRRLPPFLASERNEGRVRWHWRFDTPQKYQESMKNYYRLVTEVDAVCGTVVAELKRQGVLDRTLVIFTTDNGYFHGEHGLADKWYPYEESIRIPLIVCDPRMAAEKRGTTDDALTLNADIAPTLVLAAAAEVPASMQGEDIAPLYLAASRPAWREDYFYEHPRIGSAESIPASQALVEKQWKYVYWPEYGVEQLFDLRTDRLEENDLAHDASHRPELERMRRRFAELKSAAK